MCVPANTFAHEETHIPKRHSWRIVLPYFPTTVRISTQVALQLRELAKIFGWQLADFMRTLVCIGAVFFFLTFDSQDGQMAASGLLGMELLKLSRSFSLHGERHYTFRISGRKSSLLTLNLPESVRTLVATYAHQRKTSRNEVYYKFLTQGLLIYLKAQKRVLDTSPE
jgi:hypothetical protein